MHRRHLIALTAATFVTGLVAGAPARADEPWFFAREGLALSGYDAVAYLRQEAAVKGKAEHAVMWKGATWRFASAENRALFEMDPLAYAPQYGGYCAYAVSRGYTASTDPEAFVVEDGKLYLNYSKSVRALWNRDRAGHIAKGDANWPQVLSK